MKRPFTGRDSKQLNQTIASGRFSFTGCTFKTSAQDLISRFLKVNPLQRYTAKEALAHPWVQGELEIAQHSLPPSVFEMLRIKTRTKSMIAEDLDYSNSVSPGLAPSPIGHITALLEQTELPLAKQFEVKPDVRPNLGLQPRRQIKPIFGVEAKLKPLKF